MIHIAQVCEFVQQHCHHGTSSDEFLLRIALDRMLSQAQAHSCQVAFLAVHHLRCAPGYTRLPFLAVLLKQKIVPEAKVLTQGIRHTVEMLEKLLHLLATLEWDLITFRAPHDLVRQLGCGRLHGLLVVLGRLRLGLRLGLALSFRLGFGLWSLGWHRLAAFWSCAFGPHRFLRFGVRRARLRRHLHSRSACPRGRWGAALPRSTALPRASR
mmetsp:Transcript_9213/g.18979  ORF Transcript_9213/g.18979 Transcript_9213/m.18979 type:complete len:212 (+) Transcript_9213:623-1258(+)